MKFSALLLCGLMTMAFSCLPEGQIDADGDLVPEAEDCDDTSASIFPDAEERCGDGVDDDCDGEIDEGFDDDDDGYLTCQVAGTQADCDDDDDEVNPDEDEVCADGVDNNCDGILDTEVDEWEPNNNQATAAFLGEVDDTTLVVEPTVYQADGADLRDFFLIEAEEEDPEAGDFTLTVTLDQIPAGIDLDLTVSSGATGQDQSDPRPANSDEEVTFVSSRGDDSGVYTIEVRLAAKDDSLGVDCLPYRLTISQSN